MITKNYPFDTPSNYLLSNANDIEIVNGKGKLKDRIPTDATFYCSFETIGLLNAQWGDGNLAASVYGQAKRSTREKFGDSSLTLAYDDISYVTYDGVANASNMLSKGTIEFWVAPNYSGNPSGVQWFMLIRNTTNVNNRIHIYHNTNGYVVIAIYNKDGVQVVVEQIAWNPTALQWYHFSLNWSNVLGPAKFYIDGVLKMNTTWASQRDDNINEIRIGTSAGGTDESNFYIDEIVFYKDQQRSGSSFTLPTEQQPQTTYATDNPTIEIVEKWRIEKLESFLETATKTGSDDIKYILKKGIDWYFWNSAQSKFTIADETYPLSNPATTYETNKDDFVDDGDIVIFGVKIFLHSADGSTTPEIDLLSIGYDYGGETPDTIEKCIVSGTLPEITVAQTVKAYLNTKVAKYKTNQTLDDRVYSDITNINNDGYWELELPETDNIDDDDVKYIFEINGKKFRRKVPNETTKEFWLLEEN